jgi:hypothetical protein
VTTATPRLLLAGWYFQEVAARNCCQGLGQVAVVVVVVLVVVQITQNHKRWTVVLL